MQYKLINQKTKKETICSLVTIDGFDYYVSDSPITKGWKGIAYKKDVNNTILYNTITGEEVIDTRYPKSIFPHFYTENTWYNDAKKVICTNNPNIDISKVIDEDTANANSSKSLKGDFAPGEYQVRRSYFLKGYNKAKETYQFTEKDMIEFGLFCNKDAHSVNRINSFEKLLELFKEQQIQIIYYE